MHSSGFGLDFRKGFRKTGFKKNILSLQLVNMRHPKEIKTKNEPNSNSTANSQSGFFYGKLNSLYILRPSFGRQKVLFSKEARKGVEVSYILFGGASLGLLKPVYLEIARPTVSSRNSISIEKYDPEKHDRDQIYGRASGLHGIDEIKLYPGLHGKFALNFEYAAQDNLIRALETGAALDIFHEEVPIMAMTDNNQFYFTFYINIIVGKKIHLKRFWQKQE